MTEKRSHLEYILDVYKETLKNYFSIIETNYKASFHHSIENARKAYSSVQEISEHIVNAGFIYISYFDRALNGKTDCDTAYAVKSIKALESKLSLVYDETYNILSKIFKKDEAEISNYSIKTNWGPTYTIEMLLEHAIVHVLLHQNQIKRYLPL